MLKEGRAPMAAHETGAKTILVRSEVGGNEGKEIQRDAVDWNERVLPFAGS